MTTRQEDTVIDIDDLKPDPQNLRLHPDENLEMIRESFQDIGPARSISIDEEGIVWAGNGVVQAAKELGFKKVRTVDAAPDELVAVRITGKTAEQKRAYSIRDNRAPELARWDTSAIEAAVARGEDIASFWDGSKLERQLAEITARRRAEELGDPDHIPDLPATPTTRRGDTWILGDHRLYCGDSTVREDMDALMGGAAADLLFTDPPYGVEYVGKTKDALTIENDNLGDDGTRLLVRDALRNARLKPGAAWYICSPAGNTELAFRLGIVQAGHELRQALVWVKQQFVMGRQDYHWKHESILYGWAPGGAHYFVPVRTFDTVLIDEEPDLQEMKKPELIALVKEYQRRETTSVWREDRPHQSRLHPTMKPTRLVAKAILNSSRPGDLVVDLFAGSGTIFMAGEQTGRTIYAMEKDPAYCDVCVNRWEEYTGKQAIKEATSLPAGDLESGD